MSSPSRSWDDKSRANELFIDIGSDKRYYVAMIPISQKKCNKCFRVLPVSEFLPTVWYTKKSRIKKTGICGHCKECDYKMQRAAYRLPKGRYSCYKRNARKRGIIFKLTFDEFMTFWDKKCEYCGSKINGIGLDRADSNGIYEINNIVPCCTPCNIFKSKLGKKGFIDMCIRVVEYQKK